MQLCLCRSLPVLAQVAEPVAQVMHVCSRTLLVRKNVAAAKVDVMLFWLSLLILLPLDFCLTGGLLKLGASRQTLLKAGASRHTLLKLGPLWSHVLKTCSCFHVWFCIPFAFT